MEQELKYIGHTASPSDYECQDGELSISMDLWPENGAMKPVLQPKQILNCGTSTTVMCVHETAQFKHYIMITKTGTLAYVSDSNLALVNSITSTADEYSTQNVSQIACIGNTFVVLTDSGMEYFLWSDSSYKRLGGSMPELHLSFGLQGKVVRSESFEITFDAIQVQHFVQQFTDSNKQKITDQVLPQINKFIAEQSVEKGKFLYPFFVRYAYRLYDGSLTRHSAPVLMACSKGDTVPRIYDNLPTSGKDPNQQITSAKLRIVGVMHDLDYAVVSKEEKDALLDWSDIIQSVDIFISLPIYSYDQNGQCTRNQNRPQKDCYSICKHMNRGNDFSSYANRYQLYTYKKLYSSSSFSGESMGDTWIEPPGKEEATIDDDIRSCSSFYFLKSIKLDELATSRTIINVPADYIDTLATREAMTDDYDSHDQIVPQYAFSYNQRLNLANLKKKLFGGYSAASLIQYTDGYVEYSSSSASVTNDGYKFSVEFYVHIKQDGRDIIVKGGSGQCAYMGPALLWFYYPNINAYKVTVKYSDTNTYWFEQPLEKHDFLNGAYYYDKDIGQLNTSSANGSQVAESPEALRMIDIQSKIYTSEVNNPFSFPVLGINTVGTGRILGISTAAKALSQGQFGQFPLYAFTTDGVWALEVSSTGSYSARQPITRDVCTDPGSITQIDSAVLFATERGVMLISGSETQCISDAIDNRNDKVFDILDMKGGASVVPEDDKPCYDIVPFRTFLAGCRMLYDDTSRRIIIFNPAHRYAYIYSLDMKRWGMMRSRIARSINSYPEALAMTMDGVLVDYSKRIGNEAENGASKNTQVLMTRPLKLGYPDVLKTIDTVIQRGYFKRGNVKSILYGSRDLTNWFPIYSSTDHYLRGFRGTPYKYFRLALKCSLTDDESLSGATVRFEAKFTNQNR